ncbi:hypothetical protein SCUP234_12012 [Seiridium cupressi]
MASMAPVAAVPTGGAVAGLLGAGVLARVSGWKALHKSIPGQHPTIDGEVSTHHEGPHGCVLLGQTVRFVGKICLVLAPVDQDQASVATRVTVAFVLHVEASHGVELPQWLSNGFKSGQLVIGSKVGQSPADVD